MTAGALQRRILAPALAFGVALAVVLGASGCKVDPLPSSRVVCDPNAPRCPTGTLCEQVRDAQIQVGICCRVSGCTDGLTPDQIGAIVDAGVGSGLVDGGATCTPEACTTNPGYPCLEGRIECGSDSRACKDGPKARDGTPCSTNKLCVNGVCSVCTAGTACTTNSDQCRSGVIVCDPVGCMNSTAKSPGASCGMGQVCSAAGTCIPCATGALCSTNPGTPCKKGAIACSTGSPTCGDDTNVPDGTSCGPDKVCKAGACIGCAGGTVCDTNPGGACKLGVVSCGMSSSSGCIDGEDVSAGTSCGSNMVCNGNGQCVMCEEGKACTTNLGAPCKTGVTDCTTGAPKCIDSGNTSAGTTCGTNQVCNGTGTCVSCTAGQACTTNPSVCRNGVTSCVTGASTCVDGTPKPNTATCPGGPMCDGNGFCGVCMADQSCTGNPTACKQGKTMCNGSATTCVDGANSAAGSSCGVGMVCNGSGACNACSAGQPCTGNPNACKNGVTSCATGTQTCVDGNNKVGGTSCGTNMVCDGNGTCATCTPNANCSTNPTACKTGIVNCSTGAPVCQDFGNRSAGTACGTNQVCDGNGTCSACTAGQVCTGNPNPCYSGVTSCMSGAPTCVDGAVKAAGTGCGVNQVCNANGQCTLCTAGQSCATNPSSACKNGVTSCSTGVQTCVDDTNKAAGTSCGTNMVCNSSGSCVSCTAGAGCSGNPSACKNGVISCSTGAPVCVDGTSNVMAGVSCGSNQVCDGMGFCGSCTDGQSCSGNPGVCYNGVASCSTGSSMCVNGSAKAAGTSCGANMVCNGSGGCVSCTAGTSCTGNPNICINGTTSCATGAMTCSDGSAKAPGVSCGTNMVCNGAGSCVACTAGQSCSGNPTTCKTGMTTCSTGAMTCIDGGNTAAGTNCGTNMVCNGAGMCVSCTAGGACTTNPSICKNGTTSCSTGTQTCVDGGNKSAGTSCGTNMVCNGSGACVSCTAGQSCTGNPSICKNGVYSCMTGTMTCADGGNKPGGTSCGTNLVCDGNGNCGSCTAGQACPNPPNPCFTGVTSCTTGTMVCNNNTQRPPGTACGPNQVCNAQGMCINCTAGLSCTTNPNQCKVGITQCGTGVQTCVDSGNKPDQTGCNDGQDCTMNDVCKNGSCIGTSYTCFSTQCQSSARCNGSGGCIVTNLPDGTTCGYPDDCTCCSCGSSGRCSAGICHYTSCCSSPLCCCAAAAASGDDETVAIICP